MPRRLLTLLAIALSLLGAGGCVTGAYVERLSEAGASRAVEGEVTAARVEAGGTLVLTITFASLGCEEAEVRLPLGPRVALPPGPVPVVERRALAAVRERPAVIATWRLSEGDPTLGTGIGLYALPPGGCGGAPPAALARFDLDHGETTREERNALSGGDIVALAALPIALPVALLLDTAAAGLVVASLPITGPFLLFALVSRGGC